MASIVKRGSKWRASVSVNGARSTATFRTKTEARLWASETEAELASRDAGVSTTHVLGDVFQRYAEEVSEHKKGSRWEIIRLAKMGRDPIAKIKLIDLRREDVERWMSARLKDVKSSSVNRELNLLSHCLTQARRWRLMSQNPMQDLKRPKDPPPRDRRISAEEEERLLVALGFVDGLPVTTKQHRIAIAFLFALETAMRAGEICAISPAQVDIDSRVVTLLETKNGTPRKVPLSSEAVRLLRMLKPWGDTVFGLSSQSLSTMMRTAIVRAGIEGLTFHDTRHEAITRLATKIEVLDLARMVGHKDIKQLMVYYNKSAEEIAIQLD